MALATPPFDQHHPTALTYTVREGRVRIGVILLILSDLMFVGGQFASAGYLRTLNTTHSYHAPGESGPSFVGGLVLTILTVLAAGLYYWGQRNWHAGRRESLFVGNAAAVFLALVALGGQLMLLVSSHYVGTANDPNALDAFSSSVMFITAYHCVHLLLAALIGILLLGRIKNNRVIGYEYVVEAVGFWWYYVAAISVFTWLLTAWVV